MDGQGMSRRMALKVAAVGVAVCACDCVDGATRAGPATAGAAAGAAAGIETTIAADGWIVTTKAASIGEDSFVMVANQPFVLARKGAEVFALSTKCTHQGGIVKPQNGGKPLADGKAPELVCPRHKAQFSLTGAVTTPPASRPLGRYKLRLSKEGMVEVDITALLTDAGADTVVTIKA